MRGRSVEQGGEENALQTSLFVLGGIGRLCAITFRGTTDLRSVVPKGSLVRYIRRAEKSATFGGRMRNSGEGKKKSMGEEA